MTDPGDCLSLYRWDGLNERLRSTSKGFMSKFQHWSSPIEGNVLNWHYDEYQC